LSIKEQFQAEKKPDALIYNAKHKCIIIHAGATLYIVNDNNLGNIFPLELGLPRNEVKTKFFKGKDDDTIFVAF
jgi:hypothetical protein